MSSAAHDVKILLNGLVSLSSQGLQQIDIEENFHLVKKLGSGGYGSVLLVKDKKTDQKMALKVMDQRKTSERKFLMEFSMSFLSSHPNIIGSFGIAFKTQDHFVFAQELAPLGDLLSFIKPSVGIPEDRVKRCAVQISSALEFIAEKGLVHIDIKLENILVFDRECHCVKVTDFGLTRVKGTVIRFKTGSTSFMAPEMCHLTGEEELVVDSPLDVWAFAVLLYCLITGEQPWRVAMTKDEGFSRFVAWQNNIHCDDPPTSWNKLPTSVQRMLRSLLAVDPNQRSKTTEIWLYMEESWKMDSTLTDEDQITGIQCSSSTTSNASCSQYTSCSSNHPNTRESVLSFISCYSATERLPGLWQENESCPLILEDHQMIVGAEVELT